MPDSVIILACVQLDCCLYGDKQPIRDMNYGHVANSLPTKYSTTQGPMREECESRDISLKSLLMQSIRFLSTSGHMT